MIWLWSYLYSLRQPDNCKVIEESPLVPSRVLQHPANADVGVPPALPAQVHVRLPDPHHVGAGQTLHGVEAVGGAEHSQGVDQGAPTDHLKQPEVQIWSAEITIGYAPNFTRHKLGENGIKAGSGGNPIDFSYRDKFMAGWESR